jgi:hypothetical protein
VWPSIKTRDLPRANATRWNSVYEEICAAISQRAPFEDYLLSEQQRVRHLKRRPETRWPEDSESSQNTIFKDTLTSNDWAVLEEYKLLLEPCLEATRDLQGLPGLSKSSGIFNVMNDLLCISDKLTKALQNFKNDPASTVQGKWHFTSQIKLGLEKVNKYINKLDNSPAYLTAIILYPGYDWEYIETQWEKERSWINEGRKQVVR